MDTRFKLVFLIAVLVMCSLPIMGILKGPPLPVDDPEPPSRQVPHSPVPSKKTMYSSEDTMVEIPAGKFILGSNQGGYNEKPQHVSMLDVFWIDRFEVTYHQYMEFVEVTGHRLPGPPSRYARKLEALRGLNQPVTYVSWNDSVAYCKWKGKRLPTEREWEKAIRGTDGRTWPWGEGQEGFSANFHGEADGFEVTAPVGTFSKDQSIYGVYDGAGNVMEWVDDWYVEDTYRREVNPDVVRPKPNLTYKTMRGGGYMSQGIDLRITNRSFIVPTFRDEAIGFRCAVSKHDRNPTGVSSIETTKIKENQNNRV